MAADHNAGPSSAQYEFIVVDGPAKEAIPSGHMSADDESDVEIFDSKHKASNLQYLSVKRILGLVRIFFDMGFQNRTQERKYQADIWAATKYMSVYVSIYHYAAWALIIGLLPRPLSSFDLYGFLGICGGLVIPLLPAVLMDVPQRNYWIWQVYLFLVTWVFALIIGLRLIMGADEASRSGSTQNDFAAFIFYLLAFPQLALFSLYSSRFSYLLGSFGGMLFLGIGVVPRRKTPYTLLLINFILIQAFFLSISFSKELRDRERFILLVRSKRQIKSIREAREAERIARGAQNRFLNYIFHELRRPLHTAVLSVQSLRSLTTERSSTQASDIYDLTSGLCESVQAIAKVVNDISDLNMMESGTLVLADRIFDVSKALKNVLDTIEELSSPGVLGFEFYVADTVRRLRPLIGDENRLHQILVNLIGNAIKFTSKGTVRVDVTLLAVAHDIFQGSHSRNQHEKHISVTSVERYSTGLQESTKMYNDHLDLEQTSTATLRFEVHDTGQGIERELLMSNSLFSAFISTESGKRQGGKGTGLGLAMVRHIVELAGGRLGVRSCVGQGSTFWVEMTYAVSNTINTALLPRPSVSPHLQHSMKEDACDGGKFRRDSSSSPTLYTTEPNIVPVLSTESGIGSGAGQKRPTFDRYYSQKSFSTDVVEPNRVIAESSPAHSVIPDGSATESLELHNILSTQSPAVKFPVCKCPVLHVLVVDDDALTRKLMSRMLERSNCAVETAENGEIALRTIKECMKNGKPFDLVFLDNQMPVMSGVEMAKQLRRESIDTYICGVTGNSLETDKQEFLAAGVNKVLFKPVGRQSLEGEVSFVRETVFVPDSVESSIP